MNDLNGYTLIVVGFVLVFAAQNFDDRAKEQEIEEQNKIRSEELAAEMSRQAMLAIEMAKCKFVIPHDSNPETGTTKVTLNAVGSDSDKNDKLSYEWQQTAGTEVTIKPSLSTENIYFVTGAGEYSFQVKVTDDYGETAIETITVKVFSEPNISPNVEIQCPV